MSFANDTFTDTNNTALEAHVSDSGHAWTKHSSSASGAKINSNRTSGDVDSSLALYYSAVTPASADYDVTATITLVTANVALTSVAGRISTSANTCYFARYQGASTRYEIFKTVAGSSTVIGTYSVTESNGDVRTLRLSMVGTSIRLYVDGVLRISATDSAITAAGKPGIRFGDVASSTTLDNWSAAVPITLSASAARLQSGSTGNSVTLTGVSTSWTAGTPGSPTFTISKSPTNDASITAQSVASSTSATLTISAGTTSGTITITDPDNSTTTTIAVNNLIDVSDANILAGLSPYNWFRSGSTYIQTQHTPAEMRISFTGTILGLVVDVSLLVAASASQYPKIKYSVNNGAFTERQLTSSDTTISIASGLSSGTHTLDLYLNATQSDLDNWNTPANVLRVTGIILDASAATASRTLPTLNALFFGDSITRGKGPLNTATPTGDGIASYARTVARALDCRPGIIGHSGHGWVNPGAGNEPALTSSYSLYFAGQSRLTSGLFSPAPDYIFINEGTNDSGTITTSVTTAISSIRTAAPSAKIFVIIPIGGFKRANILSGFNAVAGGSTSQSLGADAAVYTAVTDANLFLIDCGVTAQSGLDDTSSGGPTQAGYDGKHPDYINHGLLAARITQAVQLAVAAPSGGGNTAERQYLRQFAESLMAVTR